MISVVPVAASNERILRPSLPMSLPFIASSGIFTVAVCTDCGIDVAILCIASATILCAVSSASRFDFSRISER